MAKDKKKKKGKKNGSAAASLKSLSQNPLVADVVAAALVATAAALRDSGKARKLAAEAGDEIEALAKESAHRGNAMWQLALDVGRRALETYTGEGAKPAKRAAKTTRARGPAKAYKPVKRGAKTGRKTK